LEGSAGPSSGITDHRPVETFVSFRESVIFEALPDAFTRKIADGVSGLPKGDAEFIGLLRPTFPA
jgi:hypothetical protein